MKVTLINNVIGVSGFNPCGGPRWGDREASWINHGLASVGASCKAAGHHVNLIDLRQLSGWEEFSMRIMSNPSEVYGISIASDDYKYALITINILRTFASNAKIIVGGINPTLFPEQYENLPIDTVVCGEGEITFPKLLEDIKNLPNQVKGEKPNLNKIPFVDRELFNYQLEMQCSFVPDQELPAVTMVAGRGCPFKCAFCQPAEHAVFGKPIRIREPYNVITELNQLYDRYQYRSITFWDDTFTFNRQFAMQFCSLYEETKMYDHGVKIVAFSRADIICRNPDLVKRMAEAGVNWMVIGFESGSQRLLNLISKGTTVEQNYQAAEICRKFGMKIFGSFMYGLPTETPDESRATLKMIKDIDPDWPSPFWYVPLPGTRLYEYCKEHDLILENEHKRTSRTGDYRPNIKGIDYDVLKDILVNNHQKFLSRVGGNPIHAT